LRNSTVTIELPWPQMQNMKHDEKRLLAFIRGRVGSTEDAEDILQDVLFQLVEGNFVDSIENMTAFLFRAARNRIIDWYRKKAKHAQTIHLESIAELADPRNSDSVFWDELEVALEEMPDEQRDVFVQNELRGISIREIARATGENINTLRSRKRYAIEFLRLRLREVYLELTHGEGID